MSPNEIQIFAERCASISTESDDGSGFVPVKNLIRHFNAEVHFRPLLVEAMLVKKPKRNDPNRDGWAVLLDSERYGEPLAEMANETAERPLDSRLRNTIAHELVHSLAFRHTEFGIKLTRQPLVGEAASSLVKDIEQETERLSPLLVVPDSAIEKLLVAHQQPTVEHFAQLRTSLGVSRYVLVSRLNLLRTIDRLGLLADLSLQDIGLGVGEWTGKHGAIIFNRPFFSNFERTSAPDFLLKLFKEGNTPTSIIFSDKNFVLSGGSSYKTTMRVSAAGKSITLECSVEPQERRGSGDTFLLLFRQTDNPMRQARIEAAAKRREQHR